VELFRSVENNQLFWQRLLHDTSHFQEAALYPEMLNPDFDYESVFRNFFNNYSDDQVIRQAAKVRVYEEGRKDHSLLERIKKHPPQKHERLSTWGQSLFRGKPWCIVLDKVSGCIDELTFPVARWIEPLISSYPAATLLTDISPYIGEYGYTPFGAHIDIPGVSVLHLHLGPGKKEMTVWDAAEFRKLSNSDKTVCHDFEPYLSKGTTYIIKPGDVFHLPAGTHYHIGKADEFSVGLTVALKKETARDILKRALKEHQSEQGSKRDSQIVASYQLRKTSNVGFMRCPVLKSASGTDFFNKEIRINSPFQLIVLKRDEHYTDVYVRGRRLVIKNNPEVVNLLNLLNKEESVVLSDSFFSSRNSEQQVILTLIAKLFNYGGLVLTDVY
jgi:hypothetical protein